MKAKVNIVLRITLTVLLILVQVVAFAVLLQYFTHWTPLVTAIMGIFSLIVLLQIVQKDDEAGYKIGWVILVILLQPVGGLLYLMFGTKLPTKKLRIAIQNEHKICEKQLAQAPQVQGALAAAHGRAAGTAAYLYSSTQYPVYAGTSTKYYPFGQYMYADMLAELEKAEHFIFMEYFIIAEGKMWGGILDVLKRKVQQGVDVRLLYDDAGSLTLLPGNFASEMEALGIRCVAFNKVVPFMALRMNNRDHRKIMVIDGNTAFNGGINLADEYINEDHRLGVWKDTGLMLKGDAVWSFTLMFLETWNAVAEPRVEQAALPQYAPGVYPAESVQPSGFVQPYADTPLDENSTGEDVYADILNQANDYVYIFTPYLIIGDKMRTALCLAAKRGVDVRLVTPGVPDKKVVYLQTRSHYKSLLAAGVRIFEFTPGFLHAKCFVSDDHTAVVGTINLDYRSLYLHFECATLLVGGPTVTHVKNDVLETLAECREVTLQSIDRGPWGRLFDAVVRVIAPLM